jgi:hypothetical protein
MGSRSKASMRRRAWYAISIFKSPSAVSHECTGSTFCIHSSANSHKLLRRPGKQKVKLNRLYRQDIKAESGVWTASETQTASDVHTVSDAHTAAQSEGVLEVSTRAKVVRRSARRHDDLPGTTTNKPTQNKDKKISACLCGRTYKNTRGLKTHQRSCPSTTT